MKNGGARSLSILIFLLVDRIYIFNVLQTYICITKTDYEYL